MLRDRRKAPRHAISRLARLQLPGSTLPRDCLLTNLSAGGVRLHIEGVDVPDHFVLLMSDAEGRVRPRDCRVAWRLGFELGAEFLDGGSPLPTRAFADATR